MQIVISPAKTLDFKTKPITNEYSEAEFLKKSQTLINTLSKYSPKRIAKLMSLSENLSQLNADRFKAWQLPFTLDNAKQAIFAFKGDVYLGLEADSMSSDDLTFAQQHLRILSGLYGLLKPLDLIQPYRLEMGTRLKRGKKTNLYQYWGSLLTDAINQNSQDGDYLINLASNEYFSAIKPKELKPRLITPIFKDQKGNDYKVISFFAKRARGMMARFIIDHKITEPKAIKAFDVAGYYYSANDSNENAWVFLRKEQTA